MDQSLPGLFLSIFNMTAGEWRGARRGALTNNFRGTYNCPSEDILRALQLIHSNKQGNNVIFQIQRIARTSLNFLALIGNFGERQKLEEIIECECSSVPLDCCDTVVTDRASS